MIVMRGGCSDVYSVGLQGVDRGYQSHKNLQIHAVNIYQRRSRLLFDFRFIAHHSGLIRMRFQGKVSPISERMSGNGSYRTLLIGERQDKLEPCALMKGAMV